MGKFRFSDYTPAKVAKVAKVTVNKRYPSANNLLKFAKVELPKQECNSTLAIVSNTLASQEPFKINDLSRISNISRGQSINPKISYQQHNDLWQQAEKLADFIDDSRSTVPWQVRTVRVPELQVMNKELDQLEQLETIPLCTEPVINTAKIQDQSFLVGFSPTTLLIL